MPSQESTLDVCRSRLGRQERRAAWPDHGGPSTADVVRTNQRGEGHPAVHLHGSGLGRSLCCVPSTDCYCSSADRPRARATWQVAGFEEGKADWKQLVMGGIDQEAVALEKGLAWKKKALFAKRRREAQAQLADVRDRLDVVSPETRKSRRRTKSGSESRRKRTGSITWQR